MTHSAATSLAIGALTALALAGCGERARVNMPGDKRPSVDHPSEVISPEPPISDAVKDNRFLDIVMRIKASVLGIQLCKGDLALELRLQVDQTEKNFKMFSVPRDTVSCLIYGKIGIKEMLEAGDANAPDPPVVENNITESGNVINFKVFATGLYDPPRPFLPAFISASPEELKNINVTRNNVKLTEWAEGNRTSKGKIFAKTLRYQKEVVHEPLNRRFKDVYDFEFKNEGFEEANRVSTFLFDRMEMRIALKPFAVLGIKLDSTVNKILAGAPTGPNPSPLDGLIKGGAAGGGLIGGVVNVLGNFIQVKIDGDLIRMDSLPFPGEEDSDDGVVTSSDARDSKD